MTMRLQYNSLEEPVFMFDSNTSLMKWIKKEDYVIKSEDFVTGDIKIDLGSWEAVSIASDAAWKEGQRIITGLKEELKGLILPEIKSKKRKTVFSSDDGDEVDLERLYSGLDFFKAVNRDVSKGASEITIVINPGTPFFIKSDDIFWRGASALALTEILEDAGYSVELWIITKTTGLWTGSSNVHSGCRVKRCSDPLDISTLANAVSGWFYRSAQFAMFKSMCSHFDKRIDAGYGVPLIPNMKDLKHFTSDENIIHVAGFYDKKSAKSVLERELNRIGQKQKG